MEGETASELPGAPVFVVDGRRRVVRVTGWLVAVVATAWLALALSSLVGARWVPSASVPGLGPILPAQGATDPVVRAGSASATHEEMVAVTTTSAGEPTSPVAAPPSTAPASVAPPSTAPTVTPAPAGAAPVPAAPDPNPDYTARPPSTASASAVGDRPSTTRPAAGKPAPTRPPTAHTTTTHTLPGQTRGPG